MSLFTPIKLNNMYPLSTSVPFAFTDLSYNNQNPNLVVPGAILIVLTSNLMPQYKFYKYKVSDNSVSGGLINKYSVFREVPNTGNGNIDGYII